VLVYFSGNGWSTNVIENSIDFKGIVHATLSFAQKLEIPLVLDGLRVVTFFLQVTIYNNPLTNLFSLAI